MFLRFRGLRHDLLSKFFCPAVPKKFVGEYSVMYFSRFQLPKKLKVKRWY